MEIRIHQDNVRDYKKPHTVVTKKRGFVVANIGLKKGSGEHTPLEAEKKRIIRPVVVRNSEGSRIY